MRGSGAEGSEQGPPLKAAGFGHGPVPRRGARACRWERTAVTPQRAAPPSPPRASGGRCEGAATQRPGGGSRPRSRSRRRRSRESGQPARVLVGGRPPGKPGRQRGRGLRRAPRTGLSAPLPRDPAGRPPALPLPQRAASRARARSPGGALSAVGIMSAGQQAPPPPSQPDEQPAPPPPGANSSEAAGTAPPAAGSLSGGDAEMEVRRFPAAGIPPRTPLPGSVGRGDGFPGLRARLRGGRCPPCGTTPVGRPRAAWGRGRQWRGGRRAGPRRGASGALPGPRRLRRCWGGGGLHPSAAPRNGDRRARRPCAVFLRRPPRGHGEGRPGRRVTRLSSSLRGDGRAGGVPPRPPARGRGSSPPRAHLSALKAQRSHRDRHPLLASRLLLLPPPRRALPASVLPASLMSRFMF